MKTQEIMARLQAKYPLEKEYLQAVQEVLESIEDVYNQHPEFEKAKIVERMVEPDRIFTFRVTWVDDKGEVVILKNNKPKYVITPFNENALTLTDAEKIEIIARRILKEHKRAFEVLAQ